MRVTKLNIETYFDKPKFKDKNIKKNKTSNLSSLSKIDILKERINSGTYSFDLNKTSLSLANSLLV